MAHFHLKNSDTSERTFFARGCSSKKSARKNYRTNINNIKRGEIESWSQRARRSVVVCIEKNSQSSRVCAREWIKTSDVAKPARRTLSTLRSTRLALFCCCGEFLPTQRTTNYYSLFVARFFSVFWGIFVREWFWRKTFSTTLSLRYVPTCMQPVTRVFISSEYFIFYFNHDRHSRYRWRHMICTFILAV